MFHRNIFERKCTDYNWFFSMFIMSQFQIKKPFLLILMCFGHCSFNLRWSPIQKWDKKGTLINEQKVFIYACYLATIPISFNHSKCKRNTYRSNYDHSTRSYLNVIWLMWMIITIKSYFNLSLVFSRSTQDKITMIITSTKWKKIIECSGLIWKKLYRIDSF